jgi:MFS transporter, PPP family, 3-phenylpropionic acid transporter
MGRDANLIGMPLPWRLSAFYFAHFAHVGMLVAYFPLYLAARGLAATEIALVLAVPQAARTFAPAAWGWLADRTGARRGVVLFSCAAMAAGFALLPQASGVAQIVLLIALVSVLSAGALPLVESVTLDSLSGRSGDYGPIRLWGSVGFIAVVLAGGAWLDRYAAGTVPFALVAFSLLALLAALGLPAGGARAVRPAAAPALSFGPAVRALLGAGLCMAAAHGALYAFYTLHLVAAGYSSTLIGGLWTIGVLAEILVFLYLSALFSRYALWKILVASLACAVLRFLAIGWAVEWLSVLVIAQLMHAATFGAFHAASVAAVHRLFSPGSQARGQGLFSSFSYGAGGSLGMLLAGWAWNMGGPEFAFTLAAGLGLAGAVIAVRLKPTGL